MLFKKEKNCKHIRVVNFKRDKSDKYSLLKLRGLTAGKIKNVDPVELQHKALEWWDEAMKIYFRRKNSD